MSISMSAATYYVDNMATGANNGTSWANAWTNVASLSGLNPGDTVYFSGGTQSQVYYISNWSPPGGVKGNPVTYAAGQDAGHNGQVIFDGQGNNYWLYPSASYVTFDGDYSGARHFVFTNYISQVVMLTGNSDGLTFSYMFGTNMTGLMHFANGCNLTNLQIDHCYFFRKYSGTMDGTTNTNERIDDMVYLGGVTPQFFGPVQIFDNTFGIPVCGVPGEQAYGDDGIKWGNGMDVWSNQFECWPDPSFPVSSLDQHSDMLQVGGNYTRVFDNTFVNPGESVFYHDPFGSGGPTNFVGIEFYDNVVYDIGTNQSDVQRGLDIEPEDSFAGSTYSNCFVANNTFADNQYFTIRWNQTTNDTNCVIANNLFVNNWTPLYEVDGAIHIWANKAVDGGEGLTNQIPTANTSNVTFVSYAEYSSNNNFHLAAADVGAKGNGTNWTTLYTTDHDGVPYANPPAIGAYEYLAGTGTNAGAAPITNGLTFSVSSGTITAPFILTNGYIYQPIQTTNPAQGGSATFDFVLTNGGNYVVSATVVAPSTANNSLYVNIDAQPADPTMIWDITPLTTNFESLTVCWRGNGTDSTPQFVPEVFALSAGMHQLIIRGREADTELSQITIVPWQPPLSPPSDLRILP